jgi:membrane AbrB-like protein
MSDKPKSKAFEPEAPLARQLATIAIGLVGGLIFLALGVPAGAMSGAMAACALVGTFAPAWVVAMNGFLRNLAMLASGVSIGAAVTQETLRNIAAYPFSVSGMIVCVFVMTFISVMVSLKISRWDRPTAVLAAVPGAMGFVLSAAMTTGANAPRVVTVQMMRVFFLVCLVPLILAETGAQVISPAARASDPLPMFLLEAAIGCGVGLLFTRWKIIGGMFLGAMAVSGLFHAFGVAIGRAPLPVLILGQVMIGTWTGQRFAGFDWGQFLREAPAMVGAIAVCIGVSAVFAYVAATSLALPFGAMFLAYSPGGMEAMTVMAMALGIDPFFVAAHHLARFVLLHAGLPLGMNWLIGKPKM